MKFGIDLYVIRFPQEARPFAPVAIILEDPDMDDLALAERVLTNHREEGVRWFADETFAMNAARQLVANECRLHIHDPNSDVWGYDGHQVVDYTGPLKGPEFDYALPVRRHRW